MINYKILNPKFFKKYAEYIGSVIDEGIIKFGGGIEMIGMDPSRICIFKVVLGTDSVEIIEDKKIEICIQMYDLVKVLSRFSNPDSLNIEFDEERRILKVKGEIKNKKKTFILHEIDSDIKEVPLGNLMDIDYRAIFKMEGSDLAEFVKDSEIYSEIITISTKNFGLSFRSEGQAGYYKIELEIDQEIYAEEIASYSIAFLKDVVKALKNSEIWVMFKTDYPLCLYDKVSDKTYVRFFLAPRVENPDDDDL